jgi:molybdenum cofactor cytidylyltransferase
MNTENTRGKNLDALILAAGRSVRMGRPKLLLPWGDTSILGHQIRTWQQLGAGQVVVVCAAGDEAIRTELDRLQFAADARILNPEPERGMFSSIRGAAQWSGWAEQTERVAIVLGDQPQVRQETLRGLLEFNTQHANRVCQPRVAGRARHPVILPRKVFASLGDSSASSLKEFLQSQLDNIAFCDIADPSLVFDLDTPADYERSLALCFPPK